MPAAATASVVPRRRVSVLHLLWILHARLPARLRSPCHRIPHPQAEHITPAPISRGALCGVDTLGRSRIFALAWATAVAVLSPLPLTRLAGRSRRVQAHQAALPRDLPEHA
eukprot:3899901-Prymnesium_polylepis.1